LYARVALIPKLPRFGGPFTLSEYDDLTGTINESLQEPFNLLLVMQAIFASYIMKYPFIYDHWFGRRLIWFIAPFLAL
jgi:hypothetical protein